MHSNDFDVSLLGGLNQVLNPGNLLVGVNTSRPQTLGGTANRDKQGLDTIQVLSGGLVFQLNCNIGLGAESLDDVRIGALAEVSRIGASKPPVSSGSSVSEALPLD